MAAAAAQAGLGNTHFAPLTDLAWSPDGNILVATSHDGYVTLLRFDGGQLGTPLPADKQPQLAASPTAAAQPRAIAPAHGAALGAAAACASAVACAPAAATAPVAAVPAAACAAASERGDGRSEQCTAKDPAPSVASAAAPAACGGEADASGVSAKKKKRITPVLIAS
ncbi:hypothetical protein T492DRAFT_888844 [Pavlovales sp. CCMP2436]|nr:hypothetical protein T492DRAFT_888844 [Pavlovales sp. CCMP2436]